MLLPEGPSEGVPRYGRKSSTLSCHSAPLATLMHPCSEPQTCETINIITNMPFTRTRDMGTCSQCRLASCYHIPWQRIAPRMIASPWNCSQIWEFEALAEVPAPCGLHHCWKILKNGCHTHCCQAGPLQHQLPDGVSPANAEHLPMFSDASPWKSLLCPLLSWPQHSTLQECLNLKL